MRSDRMTRQGMAAVLGCCALSLLLTRPAQRAGIHDSDSALYVVEAISLDQTSPLDLRPEWNTLVRVAAQPWGGVHVLVLRAGLMVAGLSRNACAFRAQGLYWYWTVIAAVAVALAGLLGYLLSGPPGAAWVAGITAVSLPHLRLYTQFNQVGSAALFSLLLLVAGVWHAGHPRARSSGLALGLLSFLVPFSDNMWVCTALAFPAFMWLLSNRPPRSEFVRALTPFIAGTGAAFACMLCLGFLRYLTGNTVYSCTLIHFVSRVLAQVSRSSSPGPAGAGHMSAGELASLMGAGGVLAILLAAACAGLRTRGFRDLALVPVALAHGVPLLFVSKGATLVAEYFQHALNLAFLATGVLLARSWSVDGADPRRDYRALAIRGVAVASFVLMLFSASRAGRGIRIGEQGEAWATLGGRVARMPGDAIIASTAEQEVGILYTGRRILTLNDTSVEKLLAALEGWTGRIDALLIRSSEREMFRPLIARHGLEDLESAGSARDSWILLARPGQDAGGAEIGSAVKALHCRRQPYIPYYLDAGWRYDPRSLLRRWSTAALVSGDRKLWREWSEATGLPHERFAEFEPLEGSGGVTKSGEATR